MLPENREAVTLFLSCETQWRRAGLAGVPTGLDYAGVTAAAKFMKIEPTPALFAKLRVIEAAAIEALLARHPRR